MLTAAVFTGLAVAAAAALSLAEPPDPGTDPERRRRAALRRESRCFAWLERAVLAVAAGLRGSYPRSVARAGAALDTLGKDDWRGDEYLAVQSLPLAAAGLGLGVMVGWWAGPGYGALVAVGLGLAAPLFLARDLARKAADRVADVRGRLPEALEMMALVLEAGSATLPECIALGAAENAGHPLGEEFARVSAGIAAGAAPAAMLAALARRLDDPDVTDVVRAMAASQTHGPPLKDALQTVAARLRVRQVQWLEEASERAKVQMDGPVLMVTVACLAVIVVPVWLGGSAAGRDLIP